MKFKIKIEENTTFCQIYQFIHGSYAGIYMYLQCNVKSMFIFTFTTNIQLKTLFTDWLHSYKRLSRKKYVKGRQKKNVLVHHKSQINLTKNSCLLEEFFKYVFSVKYIVKKKNWHTLSMCITFWKIWIEYNLIAKFSFISSSFAFVNSNENRGLSSIKIYKFPKQFTETIWSTIDSVARRKHAKIDTCTFLLNTRK